MAKPRLKRMFTGILINLYLGILNFLIYPLLLLLLPSRIPEKVLKFQGDLMCLLSRRQRDKVAAVLSEKLPGTRNEAEIKRIVREYFQILTSFFYYTLFGITFRPRKWLRRFVTYQGLHHLDESLKDGQGVIMPTFHFNHPFAVPGFLEYKGYKITGYAVHPWDLNVPLVAKVNAWLGYKGATLRGDVEMAYMKRDGRDVYMRRLKQDVVFVVLIDTPFPDKKDLEPMDFLGQAMLFPSRIMDVIYETGRPVHIAYTVRDNHDWLRTSVVVSERLPMTGDPKEDLQTIIKAHEAAVLRHPEQWWGWSKFERGTLAFHEQIRKKREEADS